MGKGIHVTVMNCIPYMHSLAQGISAQIIAFAVNCSTGCARIATLPRTHFASGFASMPKRRGQFIPTRQVRVVRFYVSSSPLLSSSFCSPGPGSFEHLRPVFTAGPHATEIICAQCSLPDLNHDHPRCVRCRTLTTIII